SWSLTAFLPTLGWLETTHNAQPVRPWHGAEVVGLVPVVPLTRLQQQHGASADDPSINSHVLVALIAEIIASSDVGPTEEVDGRRARHIASTRRIPGLCMDHPPIIKVGPGNRREAQPGRSHISVVLLFQDCGEVGKC